MTVLNLRVVRQFINGQTTCVNNTHLTRLELRKILMYKFTFLSMTGTNVDAGTVFPGNFFIWRKIYELQIKKYMQNVAILVVNFIMFLGNLHFFSSRESQA